MSRPVKANVICAIVRNESKYILEWIAYHHLIGFEYIFLYDNGSEDDTPKVVRDSTLSNMVKIIEWSERPGQLSAYQHFIYNYASMCNWVAFIDADEFIFLVKGGDIGLYLAGKDGFSAVLINWLIYGSSDHVEIPNGLVIDNYIKRYSEGLPGNRHVKTIARCVDLIDVTDTPHIFKVTGRTCNSNGTPLFPSPLIEDTAFDEVVINHYFTKSKKDWDRKLQRGKADTQDVPELQYKTEMFYHVQNDATIVDRRITIFSDQINAILSGSIVPISVEDYLQWGQITEQTD